MGGEAISSNGEPGTKDAEALASALNHSAERVQTLWFSFLTFMLYLAVATGTTTHRMLFLESPLKLPVLNIDLPLLGFYILTPIIFVVFHFYMLLNLVLLARTAKTFEDALARAFPDDGEPRENFRMRIENTLFAQLLAGGKLEREGINAKLLSLMALITLAVAPVALLLMFEVKFLPYHSEWITWLHRSLLVLDLALVWTLWPGYRTGWGVVSWPKWKRRLLLPAGLSAVALTCAVFVATFPDEHFYLAWLDSIAPPNTLDLHGQDWIDDAKLAHIIEKNESDGSTVERWVATVSLAGRDLTGAKLREVDIRHADFSGAILNRANLEQAWAKKAHFDNAQLQGSSLDGAQLQGASLNNAQLQGASLNFTNLRDASLDKAQLQGALLVEAALQDASLSDAQLQGASLDYALLQGATLFSAQLQGASLQWAELQGAWLSNAQLQGASLLYAQLQGADLEGAWLLGAFLGGTQLQGASLDGAQLQGASLAGAELQGASFEKSFVWRAGAQEAVWGNTRVASPQVAPEKQCRDVDAPLGHPSGEVEDKVCEWTAATFEDLKRMISSAVPLGGRGGGKVTLQYRWREDEIIERTKSLPEIVHEQTSLNNTEDRTEPRRHAMEKIEARLDPKKALEGEKEIAQVWAAHAQTSPAPEAYEKTVAEQWRARGCAAAGAPYVVRALLGRFYSLFRENSPEKTKLAAAFLDEAHCPGAHGLSEADKAALKKIAAPAATQAPKP